MNDPAGRDLAGQPCTCVRCPDCLGNGNTRRSYDSWPEFELENCDTCGGSGVTETCERCQWLEELEHDEL